MLGIYIYGRFMLLLDFLKHSTIHLDLRSCREGSLGKQGRNAAAANHQLELL